MGKFKLDSGLLLGAAGLLLGAAADWIQKRQIAIEIEEQLNERLSEQNTADQVTVTGFKQL